jgi:hypothetical protein
LLGGRLSCRIDDPALGSTGNEQGESEAILMPARHRALARRTGQYPRLAYRPGVRLGAWHACGRDLNIGQGEAGVDADAQLESHPIELPWWTVGRNSGPTNTIVARNPANDARIKRAFRPGIVRFREV